MLKPSLSRLFCLSAVGLAAACLPACEKKPEAPAAGNTAGAGSKGHDDHAHKGGDGHDHASGDAHDHSEDHGHGPMTDLGEQPAGGFVIKASRDGGVKAGGEATFDVGVSGGTARATAVRLWVGTQDAKGSIKARGESEKDGWHAHVEVPDPLPAGSKLWVEVETDGGEKLVVGFDLKQ